MENYTTQKRKVVQLSIFVLPEEKRQVEEAAKKENRSISNFCKVKIMEAIVQ